MSISAEDHGPRRGRRAAAWLLASAALGLVAVSCSSGDDSTATTTLVVTLPATTAPASALVTVATTDPPAATTTVTTAAPETSVATTTLPPTTVAPTAPPTTIAPTTIAPTTIAPTTIAPTTTIDPLLLAREQFRAITSTANAAGVAIAEQHPLTDWSAYPAYCAEMAVVARTFADAVTAYAWPAGASAQAIDLSAGHTYLATLYEQCAATDGSYDALVSIDATLRQVHDYVSNVNTALRVAIGFRPDR